MSYYSIQETAICILVCCSPGHGSRGRPKANRELKKRVSLSVLPSLYDDIQKIAYVQRWSVSELMSSMMEEYRGSHAAELVEYNEVKR